VTELSANKERFITDLLKVGLKVCYYGETDIQHYNLYTAAEDDDVFDIVIYDSNLYSTCIPPSNPLSMFPNVLLSSVEDDEPMIRVDCDFQCLDDE
jgi:hypothetical protein